MSGLRQAAEDYLALRRSLGFELVTPGRQVRQFAAYLDSVGAAHVTADLAVARATGPAWQLTQPPVHHRRRPRGRRAVLEQKVVIDQDRHPLGDERPVCDVPGLPALGREKDQDHEPEP